MAVGIHKKDHEAATFILSTCGLPGLQHQIALAIATERERCATIALEQRCERGTPWDLACVTIAEEIRR